MATNEIGATGLNRSNDGQVAEEFLPNLQGRKAIEAFKEMSDNDPVVGAVLFAIGMLVRGVQWDAEENPESDNAEEEAAFLRECMEDMEHSWAEHVAEVLTMLPYGWSWFEVVYKRRMGEQPEGGGAPSSSYNDGKVGWHKFAIRSQESLDHWEFDDAGGVKSMVQIPAPDYKERVIPMQKSLLFRTTSIKGNPEGRSALRNAYRPWYYKKHVEEQEAVGVERDLAGIPFAEVDAEILRSDATNEQKAVLDAITKITQNIKRNKMEGVVWPLVYDDRGNQMYKLSLLQGSGTRSYNTSEIIQRYNQHIAMTMLGDFILLGHEKVGSFALSSDKTDLFAVALGAYLDIMEAVYNKYAVPRLLKLNGMQTQHPPKIKHKDIENPPLESLIMYLQGLAALGVELFPDEQLEKHLREIGSLPEKSQELDDERPDEGEEEYEEEGGEEDGF